MDTKIFTSTIAWMQAYPLPADIISACWVVFITIWLLAALSTKRAIYRETRAQRLRYWIPFVIACFLLFYGRKFPYPLNVGIVPRATPIACAAAFLCITGLVFALWARFSLGRNWSGMVTLKEGHELVQRGPYRLVRHPIYTGILIMFFATALVQSQLAGFVGVLLMFASFWIKLDREERLMLQQFPERYAAYKQRVKRIIPFVL
jgi:protein-S-isoprenylcysteine O-methyltransferase Ste14